MHIVHLALQGCLRGSDIEYGITADTGGHIRYLLELVEASEQDPAIERITLVTRAFECEFSKVDYSRAVEVISPRITLVRLPTDNPGYLSKEALWQELPSFIAAFEDWLASLPKLPDALHAHYADAGEVAAEISARHAIPFVFTAHSLGRCKLKCLATGQPNLDTQTQQALQRRIAFEERAIRDATLIIASSRDEAEVQYADYLHYDIGRIRVIAPGSHLEDFTRATSTPAVDAMMQPFLLDPDKPVLLAIARPVTRKNLAALVTAYGQSKALQQRANLVVVAGVRDQIDALEPELADNLHELLTLIDDYNLYGHVAYPKHHAPEDIPALYAWARERGGVFINPALNEPFGLTLLEASAAGLPLIATDSGGPSDIIEQCGNGVLINPRHNDEIIRQALDLFQNAERWQRMADNGREAVKAYDWQSHAEYYHDLLARLSQPEQAPIQPQALLICDIDNTLTGSPDGIRAFTQWYEAQPTLGFGVATGRSFHSALSILEQAGIPYPQVIISSVGSEIYYRNTNGVTYQQDTAWSARIDRRWQKEAVEQAVRDMPELTPQGPLEQRRHKLSYFSDGDPSLMARIQAHLKKCGLAATVIQSHERYVDILPVEASKGQAVEYVRQRLEIDRQSLYAAGDSGNDLDMLRSVPCSIAVANHCDGLLDGPDMAHVYSARARHAQGIIEGVQHFQKRRKLGGAA
ncbi:sucrose-phosphate synthase [Vreelandella songnenensis]|uniref:sucrose-phosphate synthase n=1 Tax=Vreelandella songnenensis TaxID=1176243 RepID=A0A2T0V2Z7_9GAMM|nr:HAD-IIB family hydrolase [Halomonas songnenensis]PRY64438.1 sucrose-phosphate synthase [Halomonas songnenensis]